ncbi:MULTISPECIES: lipid-A-disaccharide synthase [Hymenobacter]|uniref:Lipid-A-disaccharide synthase n=1 Tax=Hymenobacter jejuensis TaxID=2502781 RepID=A0A5B8A266_9BACT|nr:MULTISPECIES: lipid-A-disaccharide synthase [Hymenobacter]MBC6990324.1 lipid-A-disaccharide synthase [Hymenobacter sp. BT491]QDA61239.1 lipid-A-disaccharide synthase [Hymenobacter jejuensis]
MKYYLIAGERSGDFHASRLMHELRQQDPEAEFRGWGGDMMQAEGGTLVHHYQEMAIMGFWEAATSVLKFRGYLKECQRDIMAYQPDVVILVDYAGFNLRVAKFAKQKGLKVFYYISPKIWAWNQGRVHTVKALVDKMFVILPFESEFYKRFGYDVDYIGNPTVDAVAEHQPSSDFFVRHQLDPQRPIIAVLPGSRKQEIEEMLYEMVAILPPFLDYQFVIAAVSNLDPNYYRNFERNNVRILFDETYDLLHHATAALVTSGTATLETALFDVPQVVCYRTSAVSYAIGKAVIKVPYISLVNLIAGKEVVKELIQSDFNSRNLVQELKRILNDDDFLAQQKAGYAELREKLGRSNAAQNAAKLMVGYLNK